MKFLKLSRWEYFIKESMINLYTLKSLSANPTKWSNTLKQFVGKLPTNCLSVFGPFVGFALKGLKKLGNFMLFSFPIVFISRDEFRTLSAIYG